MKLSISMPEEDVKFLDEYVRSAGLSSRSAALHRAVRVLRAQRLTTEYVAAFDEWHRSGESETWDVVTADGLDDDAAR